MAGVLFCDCNAPFEHESTGGLTWGGSAEIEFTSPSMQGGITWGGSAIVGHSDQLSEYELFMALIEEGLGVPDEYQDLSPNERHGVGAGEIPARAAGVMCTYCQMFVNREWIAVPPDSMNSNSPWTVSFWLNDDTQHFRTSVLLSRGGTLTVQMNMLGVIVATFREIIGDPGTAYDHIVAGGMTYGSEIPFNTYVPPPLSKGRWYHIAVTWDGSYLRLYVDGVLAGYHRVVPIPIRSLTANEFDGGEPTLLDYDTFTIGGYEPGRNLGRAKLQEVRMANVAREADWLLAEHDNFCEEGFYSAGDAEGTTYPIIEGS